MILNNSQKRKVLEKVRTFFVSPALLKDVLRDLNNGNISDVISVVGGAQIISKFFNNEEFDVPFTFFYLFEKSTEYLDISPKEYIALLEYLMVRNLRCISKKYNENVDYDHLAIFLRLVDDNSNEVFENQFNIFSKYISPDNGIKPVNITSDMNHDLDHSIFKLTPKQQSLILGHCNHLFSLEEEKQRENEKRLAEKSQIKECPVRKFEKGLSVKEYRVLQNRLGRFIDTDGRIQRRVSDEELRDILLIMESLGYDNNKKEKIINDIKKFNVSSDYEEQQKKINSLRQLIFSKEENIMYDEALSLLNSQDKIKDYAESYIRDIITQIDEFFTKIVNTTDTFEKKEYKELIDIAFLELQEKIDICKTVIKGLVKKC